MNNHAKAKHLTTQKILLNTEMTNYLKELGYGA